MSESKYREWILDTIDSLRSRKARPDLERICRMVRRRHGSDPDRTCAELDKLIQEQTVLKVNYKGSISYRNAAKVQRRSRKKDDTNNAAAAASAASSSSAARRNVAAAEEEDASHSDLSNGDSALGPADQDETEDLEADGSTVMDTDSNADEEGADESRDGQDGPSPRHTYEDGPLGAVSVHAFSAPCSPMGPRPAPSPGPGPASGGPDSASAWKSGERASSLPPSSPRGPAHSDWAGNASGSPAEHQHKDVKGAVKPVVPAVATSPGALKNCAVKREETGRTDSASSDQLVPDYGANGARADANRKVCDGRAQTMPVSADNYIQMLIKPLTVGLDRRWLPPDSSFLCVKKEKTGQNLLQWSVADVASYFSAAGFPEQSMAFRTQEIDGKSLLLMQRSDVLTGLSIRLGPALKIYERHIKVLQRTHFLEDEDL
ncbi:Atherin [Merluccius polli]|uniref:Atherin n=1 Tax=Merluccius polli TaxID=89951 RepID=A0AA47M7Y8_MERPO|nr:Atherin [Merluccius polli]